MDDRNVEAIERATVEAVAPESVEEWNGWLLPFDDGPIGRAKSAVPLRHSPNVDATDATRALEARTLVDGIEQRYRRVGLPPSFRLCGEAGLLAVRQVLEERGYTPAKPTVVQVASVHDMAEVTSRSSAPLTDAFDVRVSDTPDADWAAVFLGPGFDPVDGAGRVAALSRAPDSRYATLRVDGRALACGTISFGSGWAGIHGMRTDLAHRGRGFAAHVLAALAVAAQQRRIRKVFLQVEQGNLAASALYGRAGFVTAWNYRYWSAPQRLGAT